MSDYTKELKHAIAAKDRDENNIDFPGREELLADARRRHATFYAIASERDAEVMDMLVILRAALEVGIRAPRAGLPDSVRMGMERTADATEAAFMAAVDVVRGCPTFYVLGAKNRATIEREVFTVTPPSGARRQS